MYGTQKLAMATPALYYTISILLPIYSLASLIFFWVAIFVPQFCLPPSLHCAPPGYDKTQNLANFFFQFFWCV